MNRITRLIVPTIIFSIAYGALLIWADGWDMIQQDANMWFLAMIGFGLCSALAYQKEWVYSLLIGILGPVAACFVAASGGGLSVLALFAIPFSVVFGLTAFAVGAFFAIISHKLMEFRTKTKIPF